MSNMRYHTDNGIFRNKVFQEDVQAQRQTMSSCHVSSHHQMDGWKSGFRTFNIKKVWYFYMQSLDGQMPLKNIFGQMLITSAWS